MGSFPTPITKELFRVVTNVACGAPDGALPVPTAPIAPEPLTPEVSTPVKLITVMDDVLFWVSVAVTETFCRGCDAKARQISTAPFCALVLTTRTQVRPAPETLPTLVFLPPRSSAAIKASTSSFPKAVENVGEV